MEKVQRVVQHKIHFQVSCVAWLRILDLSHIIFKPNLIKVKKKIDTLASLTQVYNATKKGKCLFVQ